MAVLVVPATMAHSMEQRAEPATPEPWPRVRQHLALAALAEAHQVSPAKTCCLSA